MPAEIVPPPSSGRVFRGERRVRLGDVGPTGRLRLDALARYLQDVSNDDTRDAGLSDQWGWLVRRTTIRVVAFPRLGETLTLDTFCSGTGRSWAERRVQVVSSGGGLAEASTVWVHVDTSTGRPTSLPGEFHHLYTPTAAGRKVSARIDHGTAPAITTDPDGPAGLDGTIAVDATRRPWPLRSTDFDVLGHVNNAVAWSSIEAALTDVTGLAEDPPVPFVAEIGFHLPIEPDDDVAHLTRLVTGGNIDLWLTGPRGTHVSGIVRFD